jgi:hypothetical protein
LLEFVGRFFHNSRKRILHEYRGERDGFASTSRRASMGEEKQVVKSKVEMAGVIGPIWFIGWLFTVGFVHLPVWKAVWALLVWPYYLGSALR